jgi:signal transduction histidine kinase
VSHNSELSPERVLILTPTGRDAFMVEERLVAAGFACEICEDLDGLVSALKGGAGAALIAQEALSPGAAEALLATLDAQEPWCDVPVLLLTLAQSKRAPYTHPAVGLLERANVMILQRPMPLHLVLSAVRSALRARRRQYQMRDLYQELSRAVQLGDLFVSILGHDLRTPLGAIKMAAELIVRIAEDTRSLRPAGRILSAADRMTRMIEQLLDFAKARQGGGIRLQPVPTSLNDITRQVVQELGDSNPLARIELMSSGSPWGRWDPDRLGQVVSNLVGNAVQHGTAGSPISVRLDGTAPAMVRLNVENLGVIPLEAIPTLFEPFKRTPVTQGNERGLGLGLFIAREIVRAHGGDLVVLTSEGATILEATLPREACPD